MATKTTTKKTKKPVAAKTVSAVRTTLGNHSKDLDNYAVVNIGGSQQIVRPGDFIRAELLDAEVGSKVELKEVLMVKNGSNVQIGRPHLSGVSVSAEVTELAKGEKLIIFHKRRRKHSRRRTGHRQHYMVLKVEEIKGAHHGS